MIPLRTILTRSSARFSRLAAARFSNITYSGGQASEGQGGFYGSGGARASAPTYTTEDGRNKMIALAQDVKKIEDTMNELETLESLLRSEKDPVSSKAMEIKSAIKKLMTDPEVSEALNSLEVDGAPVWGLSSEEREMIIHAREKVNEC